MRLSTLVILVLGFSLGCETSVVPVPQVHRAVQALRPDNVESEDLFRFGSEDVIHHFDSPASAFRVHYTVAGSHAVPAADDDSDGVPDFVAEVASTYDAVLLHYTHTLGFRAPMSDASVEDNGGDSKFDVYLIDFNGMGDGAFRLDACRLDAVDRCVGYMVQENDFAGYGYPSTAIANRTLASHEFFHAVQANYDAAQNGTFSEGSAVWATESFAPDLNDFEAFIDGYLDSPQRSIDTPMPGPVDPFSYGMGLFFQFLGERYTTDVVRELWERCENDAYGHADPQWIEVIDELLDENHGSSFEQALTDFAIWNLHLGTYASDDIGYARAARYPQAAVEYHAAPFENARLRLFHASMRTYVINLEGRQAVTAALIDTDNSGALHDVTLLLVPRYFRSHGDVVHAATDGSTTVDVTDATSLVVLVVNSSISGESRKPGLCVGTPDEVEQCSASLLPVTDTPAPSSGELAEEPSGCVALRSRPSWALLFLVLLIPRASFVRPRK